MAEPTTDCPDCRRSKDGDHCPDHPERRCCHCGEPGIADLEPEPQPSADPRAAQIQAVRDVMTKRGIAFAGPNLLDELVDAVHAAGQTDLGDGYHETWLRNGAWTWLDQLGIRVMPDRTVTLRWKTLAAGRDDQGEAEPLTTPQQHAPDCQCPACEFAPGLAADLAKVTRERDSLARRCAVRFEEAEQLRAELAEANEKIAAYCHAFREHRAIYERALARWRLDDIQRRAIAHPGLDGLLDWLLVQADEQRQRADQAEARGYARAVAALRDHELYERWCHTPASNDTKRVWSFASRHGLADYLEAVGSCWPAAHGGKDVEDLRRPFWYTERANGVRLAVTYQGPDGIAFVAAPRRPAGEPYEHYGVILPHDVARTLALRMLASHPDATAQHAEAAP